VFKQKQWLAVVRGNHWVVAKVARRNLKVDILRLLEFHGQSELEPPNDQKLSSANDFKTWLQENHISINKLRVAVSCPGVITRMITLPLISNHDLDKLLTEQVEQYFTLNISDYLVDYRLLERLVEDGQLRQRVLLAALPKCQWETLWAEWEEIGFKPKVVDLAADGLARLYSKLAMKDLIKIKNDSVSSLDMAIVDLNSDRAEFILLEHGVFFLYSDIEVSLEGLDQVKKDVSATCEGLGNGPMEETDLDLKTAKLHAWAKNEVETSLRNFLQSLSEFFVFFAARHFGKSIDRIYLTGEYSDLPYLEEIFQSNLEINTQVGFPDAWRPRFSSTMKSFQKNAMKYGSLYGLAMREG
jgi:type IV pilus assembly protein PilM